MSFCRSFAFHFPISSSFSGLLFIAIFGLFGARARAAATSCVVREIRERTEDSEYLIRQVEGLQIRNIRGSEEFDVHELFGTKSKVLLGVTQNHVYLYAGGARHHGQMSYLGEGFRVIKKNTHSLKNGIIIDFPDLTEAEVNLLRDQLRSKANKKVPTVSCVTSAHRELNSALGIQVAGCGKVLPAQLLKNILKGQFVDKSGQPVKVEIYRTNDLPLKDVERTFSNTQNQTIGTAVITGSFVTLLYYADDIFGFASREHGSKVSNSSPKLER